MKVIHVIVVGDESVDEHLAGIPIIGAYKAILFDVTNKRREETEQLIGKLNELGIPSQRMGTEGEDYREIYWAGRAVFEGYVTEKDITFAFNLSAGSRMALAALEDALRTPIGDCHFITPATAVVEAFRYELVPGDRKSVRMAPLTFPQVPMIEPGGRWVKRLGLRQRAFVRYLRFQMMWMYFRIRVRRKWVKFKLKIRRR